MLFPYCLLKTKKALPDLIGIADTPVKYEAHEGLIMAYSDIGDTPVSAMAEMVETSLKRHPAIVFEQVIMTLHRRFPTIPMRFGETISSQEAVQQVLHTHASSIHQVLNTMGDKTELIFKVHLTSRGSSDLPEGLRSSDHKGVSYLRKKYQKHQQASVTDSAVKSVEKAFLSVFQAELFDHRLQVKPQSVAIRLLMDKSFTVSEAAIAAIKEKIADAEVSFVGQFPPYHFVSLSLAKP